jgi:hypothetical protein
VVAQRRVADSKKFSRSHSDIASIHMTVYCRCQRKKDVGHVVDIGAGAITICMPRGGAHVSIFIEASADASADAPATGSHLELTDFVAPLSHSVL